jgi:hypothetical protein
MKKNTLKKSNGMPINMSLDKKIKSPNLSDLGHVKPGRTANWSLGEKRNKRGTVISFKNSRITTYEL